MTEVEFPFVCLTLEVPSHLGGYKTSLTSVSICLFLSSSQQCSRFKHSIRIPILYFCRRLSIYASQITFHTAHLAVNMGKESSSRKVYAELKWYCVCHLPILDTSFAWTDSCDSTTAEMGR